LWFISMVFFFPRLVVAGFFFCRTPVVAVVASCNQWSVQRECAREYACWVALAAEDSNPAAEVKVLAVAAVAVVVAAVVVWAWGAAPP
jgi:hypothetical protein